jgi:TonB family protein
MKNMKFYGLILLLAFTVSFALPANAQTKKPRKKAKVTRKKTTSQPVTPTNVMVKTPNREVSPSTNPAEGEIPLEKMPMTINPNNPDSTSPVARGKISGPVSGGVLNGKATSLPKPSYPAAAKAVNASGSVSVQVLIDEEGNVVSANAVSGHPLLRMASEEAARGAKFAPTMLSGQKVKVSGVIVYNFVP